MQRAAWVLLTLISLGCVSKDTSKRLPPVTPSTHRWFPITAGAHQLGATTHDGVVSCESCHAPQETTFTAFACVGCHEHRASGTDPDGSLGMNDVHQGNTRFVYASPACYACHPSGNAGEISRADHAQYFPIEDSTKHGALACAECHTGATREVVSCTGCHRDNNADGMGDHDVAPMLAVHGQDMSELGYSWTTGACLNCHKQAQVPGTLDHDPRFPISAGTVHGNANTTCADCHTTRQDHRRIDCISCHQTADDGSEVHSEQRMAGEHEGGNMVGYAWASGSCYMCHRQSQVPGQMDHTAFFPIAQGDIHAVNSTVDGVQVSCTTCHQDPANQRNVSCTDCHAHQQDVMQPSHGVFPDYRWESASCVFCHIGGQKRINHTFFPVAAGQSHQLDNASTPALEGLVCSQCHASQTDRRQLACTTCHRHDVNTSINDHGAEMGRHGYVFMSGACFNCHPQSQVPGAMDHEPIYKLAPPSGKGQHQALRCADCHASRTDRVNSLQCTSCHQPTSATDSRDVHGEPRMAEVHQGMTSYAWSPRICISCHTDGTKDSALRTLNHTWFPVGMGQTHALTQNGGTLECANCHATPGDYTKPAIACVTCHALKDDADGNGPREVHGQARLDGRHSGVSGYSWVSTACLDCHPNGEASGNINHTRFPIAANTAHQGISCSECHLGTGPKTDVNQLNCAGCHATRNTNPTIPEIHNGVGGFMNSSPACFNCHPNSERVGPMDHPSFPINAGSNHAGTNYMAMVGSSETSCTACHASRTNRTQEKCAECHARVPTNVLRTPATAHSRVRDYSANNADCKACHAEGTTPNLSQHTAFSFNHEGSSCRECHNNLTACLANAGCTSNAAYASTNELGRNNVSQVAMRTDKTWAVDFQQYACLKCHKHNKATEENRHRGESRSGFTFSSYASPGCAACH